MKMKNKSAK